MQEHELVWDCATGNGQAANKLVNYFKKVIATDASAKQLGNAKQHERIEYKLALAEESGIATNSCDLITVANADTKA
jgi:ubiquinone/menaquinone biosynthesis C-methylase UbiE